MKIEIDMYSGRPNPEIELDGAEATGLLKLIFLVVRDSMEEDTGKIVQQLPRPQLGYRGFAFQIGDQTKSGPMYFYCHEDLYFREELPGSWTQVPDWAIEKYLKAIASDRGYVL